MNQEARKKLFVGSLPYRMTEEELREMFAPFGSILSARIITDKFTGQSKGFGFVEMENDEDAARAVKELNGKQVQGRTIIVNEARPEQKRERGGSEMHGGGERSFRRRG